MKQHQVHHTRLLSMVVGILPLLLLLLLTILIRPVQVEARDVIKVILNNGVMPTVNGDYCNEQDLMLVDLVIDGGVIYADDEQEDDGEDDEDDGEDDRRRRRQLAKDEQSPLPVDETTTPTGSKSPIRSLKSYSRKCEGYCRAFARGTCRVTNCIGYRRQRRQLLREGTTSRRLSLCDDNIRRVEVGLRNIAPALSPSCAKVLQGQKSITCFDETQLAMIDSFTLWNTDTKTIVKEQMPQNNYIICIPKNATTTPARYNIEAIPNACVEEVQLKLTSSTGTTVKTNTMAEGPYTIFGSSTGSGHHGDYDYLLGRRLSVGTYTLTTTLPGSLTPSKQIKFQAKVC